MTEGMVRKKEDMVMWVRFLLGTNSREKGEELMVSITLVNGELELFRTLELKRI